MDRFKTIEEHVTEQIIEKKSKFIANVFYIETAKEVDNKIKEIKKKYYDARHNCYAYIILDDIGSKIKKSSDDGEPRWNSRNANIASFRRKGIMQHFSNCNKILWRSITRNRGAC